MWRNSVVVVVLCLLCLACSGGIDSYEDAMEAQLDLSEEMVDVLEGVTDEASAKAAVPKIEALGERAAEIATKVQELPQPDTEELQKLMEKQTERAKEFQGRAAEQMMKLAEYPELLEAYTSALTKIK